MATDDIEQIGRLLAALPPAPRGWVEAAQQLPKVRRELDDLLARAEADSDLRARLLADLEATLTDAGIQPTRRIVADVRDRLRSH
ncbi:MAG TPA: hypothetical protein VHV52_03545 [Gaiellaceae bacterium]|jgi:hypothetical protein|nr:hypothetical protein [Gaiellaceae bacterium]